MRVYLLLFYILHVSQGFIVPISTATLRGEVSACEAIQSSCSKIKKRRLSTEEPNGDKSGVTDILSPEFTWDQFHQIIHPLKKSDPLFRLFVRVNNTESWYACGVLLGDKVATHGANVMITNSSNASFAFAKFSVDMGLIVALKDQVDDIEEGIVHAYPKMPKVPWEYGYQISMEGITSQPIYPLLSKTYGEPIGSFVVRSIISRLRVGYFEFCDYSLGWFNSIFGSKDDG
eukprot:Nitzschia sp. Nitz4//scaffold19_size178191//124638//125406//NITZ4_001995-RA/size178191-snap-gene-0.127-mRNA-1//1//CDS//3329540735//8103//frame0